MSSEAMVMFTSSLASWAETPLVLGTKRADSLTCGSRGHAIPATQDFFAIWIPCENMPRFLCRIKLKCSNLYYARLRIPIVFADGMLKVLGRMSTGKEGFCKSLKAVLSNMVATRDYLSLILWERVQFPSHAGHMWLELNSHVWTLATSLDRGVQNTDRVCCVWECWQFLCGSTKATFTHWVISIVISQGDTFVLSIETIHYILLLFLFLFCVFWFFKEAYYITYGTCVCICVWMCVVCFHAYTSAHAYTRDMACVKRSED